MDCLRRSIDIENNKAAFKDRCCIECGHCYAVCPTHAISMGNTNAFPVTEDYKFSAEELAVNPDKLLNLLRWRRSIRQFENKPVEKEKLEKLAEAARFAPTARNIQEIRYVFVSEKIEEFRAILWDSFENAAENNLKKGIYVEDAKRYITNAGKYRNNPSLETDLLTFQCPAIVAVISRFDLGYFNYFDAALGCANIEHVAVSEGLGLLHCALGANGADDPRVREFLGLKDGEKLIFTLMLGYPSEKLSYKRTPPRRTDLISWR